MVTGIRLKEYSKPIGKRLTGIAHPHRVAILYLLSHENYSTHELAENLDIEQNLLSHHLKILCQTGWIRKQKAGKNVCYELKKYPFTQLANILKATPFGKKRFF